MSLLYLRGRGVYPRVGGGTVARSNRRILGGGLSPRGRGNPDRTPYHNAHPGSIPAWAGEPNPLPGTASQVGVYPRVGGGTASLALIAWDAIGLSPRGRGNPFL